jgi:hypothetical protein
MGIATINVEVQVIHATFNFNLYGKPQSAYPIIKYVEIFVGLCMLIVENASTCAQAIFGSINACLR